MYFLKFVFVETNQLIDNIPNVIYMREMRSERSSMVAESKRRAIAYHVSVRICYMFLNQNEEDCEIQVCTLSRYLQRGCQCTVTTSDKFTAKSDD